MSTNNTGFFFVYDDKYLFYSSLGQVVLLFISVFFASNDALVHAFVIFLP